MFEEIHIISAGVYIMDIPILDGIIVVVGVSSLVTQVVDGENFEYGVLVWGFVSLEYDIRHMIT